MSIEHSYLGLTRNTSDCIKCGESVGHTTLMHMAHPEKYGSDLTPVEILRLIHEKVNAST